MALAVLGLLLDSMIFTVFSNLNGSMILGSLLCTWSEGLKVRMLEDTLGRKVVWPYFQHLCCCVQCFLTWCTEVS